METNFILSDVEYDNGQRRIVSAKAIPSRVPGGTVVVFSCVVVNGLGEVIESTFLATSSAAIYKLAAELTALGWDQVLEVATEDVEAAHHG